jgi:hypothetical protein
MRTAAQRDAKYRARMQSTQIDPVLTAMQLLQAENHTAHVNYFYPRQVQCRGLLDAEGITPSEMFRYEAYNGELYSLVRRASGPAAITEKEVLVAKYTALGCDAALLQSIALSVWEIPKAGSP